jgi:uncharacterized protein (DUF2384 family)
MSTSSIVRGRQATGLSTEERERPKHNRATTGKISPQLVNPSRAGLMKREVPKLLWAHARKTFGSASLAADWFVAECGALDRRAPIDAIREEGGRQEIDRILGCIDYGMIA